MCLVKLKQIKCNTKKIVFVDLGLIRTRHFCNYSLVFGNAWDSSFLTLVGMVLINTNSFSENVIIFFKLLQNSNDWNIL